MKEWKKIELEVLDINETADTYFKNPDGTSGVEYDEDLGTCHNQYWAGNGLTQEQAKADNPYWSGSWGN